VLDGTVIGRNMQRHRHQEFVRFLNTAEDNRFVEETNSDPKPFVWTADAKRVLAAVKRGKEKLESIH
jgi:hypothetical protein